MAENKISYPYEYDKKRRKKAKLYSKQKLYTGLLNGIIIPILVLGLIFFTGLSGWLEEALFGMISNSPLDYYWMGVFLYILSFMIIVFLTGFPVSYYSGYVIEHRYDLSNQTSFQWFKDQAKSLLLSLLLSSPLILGVFYLGSNFPEWWWLYAGIISFVIMGVLTNISHLVFFPLFYNMEELEDEELSEKLIQIAEDNGVPEVEKVVEVKAGEKTEKANAGFAGMGKTKRIYLFDTLLDKFHKDEIKSVVAHEMGHYVNKDVIRYIVLEALLIFPVFFIAGHLLDYWGGFTSISNLPIFILILFGLYSLIDPLTLAYSRHREREADRFALEVVKDPKAMISTFKRLSDISLSEISPKKIIEIMFYSHPPPEKRIRMVKDGDFE
ncbi:MAG: M48 family metalloprotease [Thermoplasmatota archaeon]